jgi:hypothetical protein
MLKSTKKKEKKRKERESMLLLCLTWQHQRRIVLPEMNCGD